MQPSSKCDKIKNYQPLRGGSNAGRPVRSLYIHNDPQN